MKLSLQQLQRAEELRQNIYRRHGAGCCCHILLDDDNIADCHVDFCAEVASKNDCAECVEILALAKRMSHTQRRKLSAGGYERMMRASR